MPTRGPDTPRKKQVPLAPRAQPKRRGLFPTPAVIKAKEQEHAAQAFEVECLSAWFPKRSEILLQEAKLSNETIRVLRQLFDAIDVDKEGIIEEADLVDLIVAIEPSLDPVVRWVLPRTQNIAHDWLPR